jgi:hypothetical protein
MGLGRLPWFERATLAASALTLAVALSSWGLMRLGLYSLGRVLAAVLLSVLVAASAWFLYSKTQRASFSEPELRAAGGSRVGPLVAFALCLSFGALSARYPNYFLLGGQDPGPYLAFAARIAKTGGLHLAVPEIERWAQAHHGLMRGFPAVYGDLSRQSGGDGLQAQFLHLFTAYDASFFAVRGVEGAVRANAWLSVLCLATGFVFVRRLASETAAFAFLVVLGLNPAFVWASRITLSEMLALWLNLSGLLLLILAWDFRSRLAAALAGAAFGLGVFNRFDGGLGSLAIFGFAVAALLGEREHRRAALFAAGAHLVTSSLGYHDAYTLSGVYCHSLASGSSSGAMLPFVTLGIDFAALGIVLAPRTWVRALRLGETRIRLSGYGTVLLGAMWVVFGLLLRPISDSGDDAHALRELTWYVGWAAWPLAFGGLALALRRDMVERALPLVAFALGTLLIYTARTEVAPFHIWASRRWVPHTIPLALAAGALCFGWLVERARTGRRRAAIGVVLGLAWLVTPLDYDAPFLFTTMLDGLPQEYERVARYARRHRDKWPLVTDHVHYGSILSYVYDVPTLVLNDEGIDALERGELAGGLAVGANPFELRTTLEERSGYIGQYLAVGRRDRPDSLSEVRYALGVGELGPSVYSVEVPASQMCFRHLVTELGPDGSVLSNGERGSILWGPWATLLPGKYRVEWYGRVLANGRHRRGGTLDVIYAKGNKSVAETPLLVDQPANPNQVLGACDFTLEHRTPEIEFRVRVEPRVRIAVNKVRLARLGDP